MEIKYDDDDIKCKPHECQTPFLQWTYRSCVVDFRSLPLLKKTIYIARVNLFTRYWCLRGPLTFIVTYCLYISAMLWCVSGLWSFVANKHIVDAETLCVYVSSGGTQYDWGQSWLEHNRRRRKSNNGPRIIVCSEGRGIHRSDGRCATGRSSVAIRDWQGASYSQWTDIAGCNAATVESHARSVDSCVCRESYCWTAAESSTRDRKTGATVWRATGC